MDELKFRVDMVKLANEPFPTKSILNGTTVYNVDNGKLYIYYKGEWYEQ